MWNYEKRLQYKSTAARICRVRRQEHRRAGAIHAGVLTYGQPLQKSPITVAGLFRILTGFAFNPFKRRAHVFT